MQKFVTIKTNSYLTFLIGEEVFAANVTKVISILELTKITKIPRTPDYIRGVINLRGVVLPIIDLRLKFDLSITEFTSKTCILVLEIELDNKFVKVGTLVDSVLEVLEFADVEILPAPSIGSSFHSDFIEGMFKADDSFIMLLNMDKLFSSQEVNFMGSEMIFAEENNPIEHDSEVK